MCRHSMVWRIHTMRCVTAAALTLLLLAQTTGCATWRPITNPIPALASAKPKGFYRVTFVDGKVVELTKLRVRGDSLFGMADSMQVVRGSLDAVPYPVSYPVGQVTRVERYSEPSAVYLTLGLLASLVIALRLSGWQPNVMGNGPLW